jgi:L-xylulokinase
MGLILSVDIGSTSVKAVLLDSVGLQINAVSRTTDRREGPGGVVEIDPEHLWRQTVDAVRCVLNNNADGNYAKQVQVVTLCGAGDGIVMLDRYGQPISPAISSLDTRAANIIERWNSDGTAKHRYPIIGEAPFAGTPVALLRWFKEHERQTYNSIHSFFFLKDWIRFRLTGELATDPSDASACLTALDGQYRQEILTAFGIEEAWAKKVPIRKSEEIAGFVDPDVADVTGLCSGTPVVTGVHDCSASSLGVGAIGADQACLILGTWSGNQVVADRPVLDDTEQKRWIVRNFAEEQKWLLIAASPSSFVNLDWFASMLMEGAVFSKGKAERKAIYEICDELAGMANVSEMVIYHPFLHGSRLNPNASAGFYGLRPWHTLPDMLRALYEGIAFNHKNHLTDLKQIGDISDVRVCGGGSKSGVLMQCLADTLSLPVSVSDNSEVSALGAAIVAAKGMGWYDSFGEACTEMVRMGQMYYPDPESVCLLRRKWMVYNDAYNQMAKVWDGMQLEDNSNQVV